MLIFDSHLDLALNAVDWNRDLRMSIAEIRAQECQLNMTDPGRRTNTVSFPELKRGQVGLGVATLIARQERQINHFLGYTTVEACYAVAMSHVYFGRPLRGGRAYFDSGLFGSFRSSASSEISSSIEPI